MTITGQPRRPVALTMAAPLLVAAALPFPVFGVAVLAVPLVRFEQLTGLRPKLDPGVLGYRLFGVAVLLLALGYGLFTALAHQRRGWARTATAALTGVFDVTLMMVLLAGALRTGWLLLGAAVVLASLAGVVLSYQPEVDRYLTGGGDLAGGQAPGVTVA